MGEAGEDFAGHIPCRCLDYVYIIIVFIIITTEEKIMSKLEMVATVIFFLRISFFVQFISYRIIFRLFISFLLSFEAVRNKMQS